MSGLTSLPQGTADLLYTLLCSLMLLAWVLGVTRRQRRGLLGRMRPLALMVPAGVLALYFGLASDLPPLIGVGIALMVLGEYLPWSYRAAPRRPLTTSLRQRLAAFKTPDLPDLELHLEPGGAVVKNVGRGPLTVQGWSPTSVNAWWPARQVAGGAPITRLAVGRSARLSPWPLPNSGVRVWYRREGDPVNLWLFRADWPGEGVERTLN